MGQLLLEQGALNSDQLAIAVAERFGLQHVSLDSLNPDVTAMNLVPAVALRRLDAVPIGFRDDTLLVAMINPTNVLALDDLAMLSDLRVEPVVVSREDLDVLLQRVNGLESDLDENLEHEPAEEAVDIHESSADDAPTVKLVRSIIAHAIESGASDIHFDPNDGELRVRYRIDGIMAEATTIPQRQAAKVVSRIKILSELDISERRLPQDGRHEHDDRRAPDRHPRHRRPARRRRGGGAARARSRDAPAVARRDRHGRRRPCPRRGGAGAVRTARSSRPGPRGRASRRRCMRRSTSSARRRRRS